MNKMTSLTKALGPGILIACAAIGASHLVWSTMAGASYGWSFIILILLANFLKFPFFYYGQNYTSITGESLLSGYKRLGEKYLYLYTCVNLLTGSITISAVGMLTAAMIASSLDNVEMINLTYTSIFIFIILGAILVFGKYSILEKISKIIIIILTLFTIIAVIFLIFSSQKEPSSAKEIYNSKELFSFATLAFIIKLFGWMPAPLDLSVWPSLWMHSHKEKNLHNPSKKEVTIDFTIGYLITTILACLFLALGVLALFNTGTTINSNITGIEFSNLLISMYTNSIGIFAKPIIIIAAFFTMLSTTLTCLDGYPRSLAASITLFKNSKLITSYKIDTLYKFFVLMHILIPSIILIFFVESLLSLLSFIAIIAFLTSPIIGWLNIKVMTGPNVPKKDQPAKWIKTTSYFGLFFFIIISLAFIVIYFSTN